MTTLQPYQIARNALSLLSINVQKKVVRHPLLWLIGLFVLISPWIVYAANPDGDLRIDVITAYNFVVDSNVESPSTYAPEAATIGAQFCNDGSNELTDVFAYVGNFTGDPNTSTPGIYASRTHAGLTGTFSLTHEGGSAGLNDAVRYIPSIPAGECVTQYWLVSYPRLDDNGNSVTGGIKPDDDLWLEYDIWAEADDNGTHLIANETRIAWMRNEISASANKIWPNGDNKVPSQYLNAIAEVFGWETITPGGGSEAYPGELVKTQGIWYDLGNVGHGFDNDGDGVPDKNAWLQPVGDPDTYDPGCFRLVRTWGIVIVKLKGGGEYLIPFEDQLYFEHIPDNTGAVGLVFYEYAALDGVCSAGLTPYQEVASGFDNEKFSGDYGAGIPPVTSKNPTVTLDKNVDLSTLTPAGILTYTLDFVNPGPIDVGLPEFGMPLVIRDSIPEGTIYRAGTAAATSLPAGITAKILYSHDGGLTWSANEAPAATVTNIQWWLSDKLGVGEGGTVTFEVDVPGGYSDPMVSNTGAMSIGNGRPFGEDTAVTLITGANEIQVRVYEDDGAGIFYSNGNYDSSDPSETGIVGAYVSLYAVTPSGEYLISTQPVGADGLYTFSGLADGDYKVVVDPILPAGYEGWTNTSPISIEVHDLGASGDETRTGHNFGFAMPLTVTKSLTTATPATAGSIVTFEIDLENNLAGGGTPYCTYTLWAPRESNLTSGLPSSQHWQPDDPTQMALTFNVNGPDGIFAESNFSSANDKLGGEGFNTAGLTGNITSVIAVYNLYAETVLRSGDTLESEIYIGGMLSGGTVTYSSAIINGAYLGVGNQGNLERDITGLRPTWTWADIANTDVQINAAKSSGAGTAGVVRVDAIGLIVTTDQFCTGNNSTTMSPVPLTDDYDPNFLEFVSADPSPDDVDTVGGLLTWNDVGPIYAGGTRTITVNFRAKEVTASTTNTANVTNAYFGNGRPVNDATDSDTVEIQAQANPNSISGTLWREGDSGTTGWVNTDGYENLGTTDFGIQSAIVNLYACTVSGAPLYPSPNTSRSCAQNGGTWTVYRTTTTDANGAYSFTNLPNGYYYVEVDQSSIFGTVTQTAEANDNQTTGGHGCPACNSTWGDPNANLNTANFNPLDSNENLTNVNFGYSIDKTGSSTIGDLLYFDENGNGTKDPLEDGIPYVTIQLYEDNNNNGRYDFGIDLFVAETSTDANGAYLFTGVPAGNYIVRVVESDPEFPQSVIQTADPDETGICSVCNGQSSVTTDGVSAYLTEDFGYMPQVDYNLGTMGDTIFWDVDGDGEQDWNEAGISGVTVMIYRDENNDKIPDANELLGTDVTDQDGKYLFPYLTPGYRYIVVVGAIPGNPTLTADPDADGLACTDPAATGCDGQTDEMIYAGTNYTGADFGYQPTGIIGDFVWFDQNGDGIQDAGEPGIANVLVRLYLDANNNGVGDPDEYTGQEQYTDIDGYYYFINLANGNYVVEVDDSNFSAGGALEGYTPSGDPDEIGACVTCDNSGSATLTNDARSDRSVDFGYELAGTLTLSGTICLDDPSEDGICSTGGETNLEGLAVYLYDNNGKYLTQTTTLADGSYSFTNLVDSTYKVSLSTVLPPLDTADLTTVSTTGRTVSETITTANQTVVMGGVSQTDVDFAFASVYDLDFGDLPDSYSTLLTGTPDGARHIIPATPNLWLGTNPPDAESDGQPGVSASGDGSDEDGVTPIDPNSWTNGDDGGAVQVVVNGSGWLIGWIDFNDDGDFNDSGEMIINQSVSTGTHNISFDIPSGTLTGGDQRFYARFRLFPTFPGFPNFAYSGLANNGEVEDYRFTISGFDLALQKTLAVGEPDTIEVGQNIRFTITIYNQGAQPAYNVVITDTMPDGFELSMEDMNGWMEAGGVLTNTIAGPIAPGSSAEIDLVLTAIDDGTFVNTAEISAADNDTDPNNAPPVDVDSVPDSDPNNDGTIKDNEINEDYLADPDNNDSDDHDTQEITVASPAVFDLALTKTNTTTDAVLGGAVTFEITVYNQGTVDAYNVELTDTIPAGFVLSAGDTNGWSESGGVATLIIPGPIAAGASTSVEIALEVIAGASGVLTNTVEISAADNDTDPNNPPPTDIDSEFDTDPNNDGTVKDDVIDEAYLDDPANNDSDDHDRASINIINPAIAIDKTPDTQQVVSGSDVTFTLTVTNPGDVALSNINVNDAQCDGGVAIYVDGDTNGDSLLQTNETWTYSCTVSNVDADFDNTATVTGDDPLGNEVSDEDTASVDVVSPVVEIVKTVYGGHDSGAGCATSVDSISAAPGSPITYCFAVTNTGDSYLNAITITDDDLQIGHADLTQFSGDLLLEPGETAVYYYETYSGEDLTNTADVSANPVDSSETDLGGDNVTDEDTAVVTMIEPQITTEKTITAPSPATDIEAGNTITYRLRFTNTGEATAYDVSFEDTLPAEVSFNNDLMCDGAPVSVDLVGNSFMTLDSWEVGVNETLECTFTVTVLNTIVFGGTYTNKVDADWSSQPGDTPQEREYSDQTTPYPVDGDQDTDSVDFTAPATLNFTKTDNGTTEATIGDTITYTLTVDAPLLTIEDLVIEDVLPQGMIFTGVPVLDGFSASPAVAVSSPNDGSADVTLTWDFGDVAITNQPATITFTAVVANVASNQQGVTLTNNATLNYTFGGQPQELTDNDDFVITEPILSISKTLTVPASGNPDAGGAVEYEIVIQHTAGSNADAYDVVFTDALPSGLNTFNVSVSANGITAPDFSLVDTTLRVPSTGGFTLPNGASVTITISAVVDASVAPGTTVSNTGSVVWDSQDGSPTEQRSEGDGVADGEELLDSGSLNDYEVESTAAFTVSGDLSLSKTIASTSEDYTTGSNVTIGEVVTYQLEIELPSGTLSPLTISDNLPDGMAYVAGSVTVVGNPTGTGFGTFNVTPAAGGTSGQDLQIQFPSVSISDNTNPLVIEYDAVVLDVAGNIEGTQLINSATVQYGTQPTTPPDTTTVTVVEPELSIVKLFSVDTATAGNTVQIRLEVSNTGSASAFDVTIEDPIDTTLFGNITEGTTPGGFTFSTQTTSNITTVTYTGGPILAGTTAVFTFNVTMTDSVQPGEVIENTASLTGGSSKPGDDPNERDVPPDDSTDTITGAQPDLIISKSHSGDFTVGVDGNFTLEVRNIGDGATSGTISIVDTLPAELAFVSASGTNWTCLPFNPITLELACSHPGPLAPNTTLADTLTVTVNPNTEVGSPFTNNVTVSTTGESDTTNNNDSDSVNVNPMPRPDLTIDKSHSGDFTVGQTGTFTISVENIGNATAIAPITVSDTVPSELDFVSASGNGWTCNETAPDSNTFTCTTSSDLDSGLSLPDITVEVVPLTAGSTTNTATVAAPSSTETNTSNNSDDDSVTILEAPKPDLAITKSHSSEFVVNEQNTFTIDIENVGSGATTGTITVTDTLPTGMTFVSGSGTDWTCSAIGQDVTCNYSGAALQPNDTTSVTITVLPTTTNGSPFTNTAVVETPDDDNDTNDSDDDEVPVTEPGQPDLTIDKRHSANFTVGSDGTFEIEVSNVGNETSSGTITVVDTLPDDLTYVNASGTDWQCDYDSGSHTITCEHPGDVDAGHSLPVITVVVNPVSADNSPLTNTATVTNSSDSNSSNNEDDDEVTVDAVAGPDVSIDKSHTSGFVIDEEGEFIITVTNVGSADTTGDIVVTDSVPDDLEVQGADGNGWTCDVSGQDIECTYTGTLSPTESAEITITVIPRATGDFTNSASVDTEGDDNDSNDEDDDEVTVTQNPEPDLEIEKSHSGVFTVGEEEEYTIEVRNVGSADTTGDITVTDTLPDELDFVDADGDDWDCDYDDGSRTVTCEYTETVGAGASLPDITITVIPTEAGTIVNSAEVDTDGDNNDDNDEDDDTTVISATGELDLTIDKSHNGDFTVGEQETYRLIVTNVGDAPTTGGITVTDRLPDGMTYVSGSDANWTCDANGQEVTCNYSGDGLPLGANQSLPPITLVVELDPLMPHGTVENVAEVETPGDNNPDNNDDTDPTNVKGPGVYDPPSLFKTVNDDGYPELEWQMLIINPNDVQVATIVHDYRPDGTTVIPASVECIPGAGTTITVCEYDAGLDRVVYEGVVGANSDVTIIFRTLLPDDMDFVENRAQLFWDEDGDGSAQDDIDENQPPIEDDAEWERDDDDDDTDGDDTDSGEPGEEPGVVEGEVNIRKGVFPSFADAGDEVKWTITVTNATNAPITNLDLSDTVPSELTILSVESSAGTAYYSGQTVALTDLTLNAGDSITVTINTRLRGDVRLPNSIENIACAIYDGSTSQLCDDAELLPTTTLPATGESPLTAWRPVIFAVILALVAGLALRFGMGRIAR